MKIKLSISILLFSFSFLKPAVACSPFTLPTLDSMTIAGCNLNLQWTSNTAYPCDYNINMEIVEASLPFTGIDNYFATPILKPNTLPMAYPLQTINICALCPGVTYKFQARECSSPSPSFGCSGYTPTYTFTVPGVSLSLNPDTVCINAGAYALTGGSPSGGTYSGVGVSVGNFDPNVAGAGLQNIIYTYSDTNNCNGSDTAQIFVDLCATDVESFLDNQLIIIFPNPTTGIFTIQVGNGQLAVGKEHKIEIYNVYGEKVMDNGQLKMNNGNSLSIIHSPLSIDLSSKPDGIYFLQLRTSEGVVNKKIIIQR